MQFKFKRSRLDGILLYLKYRIFNRITKKSNRLFLKGGDVISTLPFLGVEHEAFFSEFLRFCSKQHGDFFLDIGANVGLITCQVGNEFDQLDLVEPNLILQNILKSNLLMSFNESKYKLHEFGLGTKDGHMTLQIPKHNFGGAFIKEGNSYDEVLLAKKDGFPTIAQQNYITMDVKIKSATAFFSSIFQSYLKLNKTNGVIKIDVEGYEMPILQAIKQTLPPQLNLVICFENHDAKFTLKHYLSDFRRDLDVYMLTSGRFGGETSIRNRLQHLMFGWNHALVPVDLENLVGDLVIHIKKGKLVEDK